ncbi:MOSC domain-containing protein [Plastorhodobacter daqingensis]|uniref:MOSC domain-containing protein n=1 Tax=Plastorhodobacter daqingensis TaxID=1387281 RepID=A0ABW2ULN8_9RHOB
MPVLRPTRFHGRIEWLGIVPDRGASLRARAVDQVAALFSGPEGEAHGGLTRPSCSRVSAQYRRGTPIRNTRQFSILAHEDLTVIAAAMGLASLDPALLGANMVVSGIPDFSHLPPASRLQAASGATLTIDLENRPCTLPVPEIDAEVPGAGRRFPAAARGRRGVTAWVEAEGLLNLGDTLRLHVPDQPVWACLDEARAAGG